ncbi:hypothetical protein L3X38_025674 [Prunus dulcis]|uniref:RecA family profile 1 domain-containing protein n=1 Tax=Prunus dulcis TaxID=3755 RepID=A0AAD4Z7K6_PRUDU|nr:hypothetical protein L3X38_025674 [Prunus dulcis]
MTPQNLMLLPLSTPKLSIGCPILDHCLGGGIPCNSITELVGESGSRKTQLCLQLTVRAQLPPSHGELGGSSFYIFTEFSFPFRRLQQLGNLYHASYPNLIRLEPLEDIYVHGVHDAQQLIHVLGDIEAFIAIDHTRLPVKLIVIDSIAALFRSQYQTTPAYLKRRSEMFFNISGRRVSPALGLAWAHCINSRVFLARHEQSIEVDIRNAPSTSICSQTHQTFHLVFAPHLAYASAEFVIRKEGIVGVSQ